MRRRSSGSNNIIFLTIQKQNSIYDIAIAFINCDLDKKPSEKKNQKA